MLDMLCTMDKYKKKREDCEVKEAWGTFIYILEQEEEKQQTP